MFKGHEKVNDKTTDPFGTDPLTQEERDELAVSLFQYRASALAQGNALQSLPLRKIRSDLSDDKWFLSASGRGVMLLSELRRRIGPEQFDAAMDAFGRAHAGQPVDSQAFITAMSAAGGQDVKSFFSRWLDNPDALPTLELSAVTSEQKESKFTVSGRVLSHGGCTPSNIDLTVETEDGETTSTFPFQSEAAPISI